MIDFPGRMAAIMFFSGCNFTCGFCHNATLMGTKKEGLPWDELEKACNDFKEQWVNGIVLSGGEPTLDEDELNKTIDLFIDKGFAVKLDTNGSAPEKIEKVLPKLDYIAMDVKTSLSKYKDLVGYNKTENIKKSIDIIKNKSNSHEFRTTVIEGIHSEDDMREICSLVKGAKRYVLQPFIPQDDLPGEKFRRIQRTSPVFMRKMESIAQGCADEVIARGT